MKIKQRINEFLKQIGYTEDDITFLDSASVYIAQQIAMYAHRSQIRLNGKAYFVHPYNVMQLYRNFTGIVENDYFCVDTDLLEECHVPYNGAQEVCLLHDVLEDTDVTLEEIEEVFEDLDLGLYFKLYVKSPLLLVTHDKSEDYDSYVNKILENPIASIVKFMDMSDNLNPSNLDKLGDYEFERMVKYAHFCKMINDKYHFLENIERYKKLFNKGE